MESVDTDYLVVGAGAMGMAFADVILTETPHHIVIVDRYDQPGGHWTTAYPFVRLHQPSTFYGVNSKALGNDTIDLHGWNKGLMELASAQEILHYYQQVMKHQFLPSGRVSYFPMSEYLGDGRFRSLISGKEFQVNVRKRVVDSTYMKVEVPSMRPPRYAVADGVTCVSPNELPKLRRGFDQYTIVGGGKTGMDACLWLLQQGVAPARLRWIIPRDPFVFDRADSQPGAGANAFTSPAGQARAKALVEATSVDDLFDRLSASGMMVRLFPDVRPTNFRCATVTQAELTELRKIEDIVRKGRVERIDGNEIVLQHGTVKAGPNTVYIDCTGDGLAQRPVVPVFSEKHITLQTVIPCQQVFSAALIAHVEAAAEYTSDQMKNDLCLPSPHPNGLNGYVRSVAAFTKNILRWYQDPGLFGWLQSSRLFALGSGGKPPPNMDPAMREAAGRQMVQFMTKTVEKYNQLIAAMPA